MNDDKRIVREDGQFRVRVTEPDLGEGWCEENAPHATFGTNPKITLDTGQVVWGFQVWWTPIEEAVVVQ